jgi:sugar-specific transcriptional regulator TrmB
MKKQLIASLEKIGLTDSEATLYLAAMSLGECGMSELSQKAGLRRTSAYVIAERLEERGLLGTFKTKQGTRYVPKDPKHVLDELHKHTRELEHILPQIQSLYKKSPTKPSVIYYEGVDDYIRAVELCLKKNNETIYHIGSLAEGHQTIGEDYDFKYFAPTRIKKNIFLKALYTPDVMHKFKNETGTHLREIRFLPEQYPLKTLTLIFGSTVVISTTKKTLATIVIESEEIAAAERMKFEMMWDATKRS